MMSDQAHAIVLNPNSNGKKGFVKWQKFLKSPIAKQFALNSAPVFDGKGCSNFIRLEKELRSWIVERLRSGCQNFVAAGGDGTVNLVLNILMNLKKDHPEIRSCRLGAVGLGSSNDFHKPLQSHNYDIGSKVYYRLNFNLAFPHDVGRVETTGVRFFAINASIGITAQANLFFNQAGPWFQSLKRKSVSTAILLAALREFFKFQSFPVRIMAQGQPNKILEIVNLGIVKNPYFAGSFHYDRPQKADDGHFGVYICEKMKKTQVLKILVNLSRGIFSGQPGTDCFQTAELSFDSCSPFALETDGEVVQVRNAKIKNLKREIYICPL